MWALGLGHGLPAPDPVSHLHFLEGNIAMGCLLPGLIISVHVLWLQGCSWACRSRADEAGMLAVLPWVCSSQLTATGRVWWGGDILVTLWWFRSGPKWTSPATWIGTSLSFLLYDGCHGISFLHLWKSHIGQGKDVNDQEKKQECLSYKLLEDRECGQWFITFVTRRLLDRFVPQLMIHSDGLTEKHNERRVSAKWKQRGLVGLDLWGRVIIGDA